VKLTLDENEFEEFDPLEEVEEEEEDEEVSVVGHAEKEPQEVMNVPETPSLTPAEQVEDLLKKMQPQKRVILGIIDYCREPRAVSDVDEFTLKLQEYNKSVYTPVNLRALMERNSCLVYLEPEPEQENDDSDDEKVETLGELAEELDDAPETDQVEYLVVTDRPEGKWQSTPEAVAYYDAQDPIADLRKILADNVGYEEIIIRILRGCDGDGLSANQLSELVDDDPIMKHPFRTYGYFIGRLEKAEAVKWEGAWKTTDSGRVIIAEADAIDAEEAAGSNDEIKTLKDELPTSADAASAETVAEEA